MTDEPLGDAQRERLEIARRSTRRLQKLVNTLLDFARIEAGRVQASYVPVDLAALTADLASSFRSAAERGGLELIVDCPPLAEPVYVDREMWEKIVLNLVSNAFKFTLEGRITVRLRRRDARAVLEVIDTGTGIAASELPRIFDRFHRVEGAKSRTHEGTGIGLALVQELAKMHGGDVKAESTEGRGSTFTVTVPFGTAHLPRERIGATSLAPDDRARGRPLRRGGAGVASGAPPPMPTPARGAAPRASSGRTTTATCASTCGGCSPDAMTSRPSPTERRRSRRRGGRGPISILSDVMMPKLDGQQLPRAVRADPAVREVPVVLLSARAGEEARIEALKAGADDYVVKPFSARELLARIDSRLQIARLGARRSPPRGTVRKPCVPPTGEKTSSSRCSRTSCVTPSPPCATASRSCACNTSGRSTPAGPTT